MAFALPIFSEGFGCKSKQKNLSSKDELFNVTTNFFFWAILYNTQLYVLKSVVLKLYKVLSIQGTFDFDMK